VSARSVSDVIGDPRTYFSRKVYCSTGGVSSPGQRPSGEVDLFGNAGRNILTDAVRQALIYRKAKTSGWRKKTRLQFRVESFNVFNTPNYRASIFQLDNVLNIGRAGISRRLKDASFSSR